MTEEGKDHDCNKQGAKAIPGLLLDMQYKNGSVKTPCVAIMR